MPRGSHSADASHSHAKRLLEALLDYQSKTIKQLRGLHVRWEPNTSHLIVKANSMQILIDLTSKDRHEDSLSRYKIENAIQNMQEFLAILKPIQKKQNFTLELPSKDKSEITIWFDQLWNEKRMENGLDPINLAETYPSSHQDFPDDTETSTSQQSFEQHEGSLPDDERPEIFLVPPHQQLLQDALESAQQEVWIFGNTLDVTFNVITFHDFLEVLRRGVVLRFLVFDLSDERDLHYLVEAGDGTRQDAISSCIQTYSRLLDLMNRWRHDDQSNFEPSLLQVKLTPNPLKMRMVVVDRDDPSKKSYFIPSVNRSKTARLPWFLCRNTPHPRGLINTYADCLDIEWRQSHWIQDFLQTEPGAELLREYPDIIDSYSPNNL